MFDLENKLIFVVLESFLPLNKSIDNIIAAKSILINDRNKIIDNSLKYFLPSYKKKLLHIENQLDKLDLAIYELEKVVRDLKVVNCG